MYDSYKTDEDREYIVRVYDVYNFLFCFVGSILITITCPLAQILYSKDFYAAWRYVPLLIISIVLSSASGLMGNFLSIYKKTKKAMAISIIAALSNSVLNYILVIVMDDAMGAAIATAFTIITLQNIYIVGIGLLVIIALNWGNILWAKSKWKNLIRRSK